MISSILFDLDGVLANTKDIHFRALNTALIGHGYSPITPEAHEMVFNGMPTAGKLNVLACAGRVRHEDVASILALKQKETRILLEREVKFDANVYCLLWGLKSGGFKLGVVTNAIPETTLAVLTALVATPQAMFDTVVCNTDGEPKPSPDLYTLACRRLVTDPSDCLAIEDGRYGIEAATAAGCRVMKVNGTEDVTPRAIWEYLV